MLLYQIFPDLLNYGFPVLSGLVKEFFRGFRQVIIEAPPNDHFYQDGEQVNSLPGKAIPDP